MESSLNKNQKFSIIKRLKSFKYAFNGIFVLIKNEHNAWIHLAALVVVVVAGIILKLSYTEWALVVFAIGFVFAAEAFNTAIETLVDLVSPEFDKKAGLIKDVAAGAVLIVAITTVVIGILIFGKKILQILQ